LEIQEEKTRLQVKRTYQQEMAKDLEVQIAMKKDMDKHSKDEERRLFEHQEVELERWKAEQVSQQEEVRRRAIQVQWERERQDEENRKRKEEERARIAQEESELVKRAAREMDQERQIFSDRKVFSKQRQMDILHSMQDSRDRKSEVRQTQIDEERKKVAEYKEMLAQQEVRNRQCIPAIRGVGSQIKAPPGGRKGDDFYTEENVMKQLHTANAIADSAEHEKIMTQKTQKLNNQDFLFHQIAERNKNREKALDHKRAQKLEAQAATNDYLGTERKRIDDARSKNERYRLDLERQMAANKAVLPPKGADDAMSPNEKAINQHLIQEAEQLKQQWLSSA